MIFYFLVVLFDTVTLVHFKNMSNCPEKISEELRESRIKVERGLFEFLRDRNVLGEDQFLNNLWLCHRYATCFKRVFENGYFNPDALGEDEYNGMRDFYKALCDEMQEKYNKCLDDVKKYMIDADFVRNEDEFNEKKFGLSCLVFLLGSIEQLEKFSDVILEGTELGERVRALKEEVQKKVLEAEAEPKSKEE